MEERNLFLDFKSGRASDLSILLCARSSKSLFAMTQELTRCSDLDLLQIYQGMSLKEDFLRSKKKLMQTGPMFSPAQLVPLYAAFLFVCATGGFMLSMLITLIATRGRLTFSPVFALAFALIGVAVGVLGMMSLISATEKEAFSDISQELEYLGEAKEILEHYSNKKPPA